jgi:hypothetical protein
MGDGSAEMGDGRWECGDGSAEMGVLGIGGLGDWEVVRFQSKILLTPYSLLLTSYSHLPAPISQLPSIQLAQNRIRCGTSIYNWVEWGRLGLRYSDRLVRRW